MQSRKRRDSISFYHLAVLASIANRGSWVDGTLDGWYVDDKMKTLSAVMDLSDAGYLSVEIGMLFTYFKVSDKGFEFLNRSIEWLTQEGQMVHR